MNEITELNLELKLDREIELLAAHPILDKTRQSNHWYLLCKLQDDSLGCNHLVCRYASGAEQWQFGNYYHGEEGLDRAYNRFTSLISEETFKRLEIK